MEAVEILSTIGVPILTAIGGWFASVWRNKQKKESDILDNVKQILEMQKAYIKSQDEHNRKLEAKLDDKRRSIRQANWCKFTNEGDGCPVLNHEQKVDADKCDTCKYNPEDAEGVS